jgi:hypothetical protein
MHYKEFDFAGAYVFMFEPNAKKVYLIKENKFNDCKTDWKYTQPYLPDPTWIKTYFYCYEKSKLICYDMITGIKLK